MTTTATRADVLAERKAQANARIGELERQAGIALIDGKNVSAAWQDKIEAQRRELIAAEAAETELVNRQREAAAAEHAARVKALRDGFREQEAQRLAAVARAHKAANQLVSALRDALRACEGMRQCCQHLGKAPPVQLSDFDDRLSGLLSGLLAKLSGKPQKFGNLTLWQLPNTHDWRTAHERDWEAFERQQLAGVLAEISPAAEGHHKGGKGSSKDNPG
jgi:hypothetical protein